MNKVNTKAAKDINLAVPSLKGSTELCQAELVRQRQMQPDNWLNLGGLDHNIQLVNCTQFNTKTDLMLTVTLRGLVLILGYGQSSY